MLKCLKVMFLSFLPLSKREKSHTNMPSLVEPVPLTITGSATGYGRGTHGWKSKSGLLEEKPYKK